MDNASANVSKEIIIDYLTKYAEPHSLKIQQVLQDVKNIAEGRIAEGADEVANIVVVVTTVSSSQFCITLIAELNSQQGRATMYVTDKGLSVQPTFCISQGDDIAAKTAEGLSYDGEFLRYVRNAYPLYEKEYIPMYFYENAAKELQKSLIS